MNAQKSLVSEWRVFGHAFVPVEIEVKVHAQNPREALIEAERKFNASDRQQFIVPNSQDRSAVFDFKPFEATRLEDPKEAA